jgi:hypothetical protein
MKDGLQASLLPSRYSVLRLGKESALRGLG